jgi:2-keto-4-pentenoate hydratase/2-oxohepta-3-ene-1,7-dioic acid hydratase in catechol pathway
VAEIARANAKDGKSVEIVDTPKYPVFFTKSTTTVIGHNDFIESHSNITNWLDYEAELAVVIGMFKKKCFENP